MKLNRCVIIAEILFILNILYLEFINHFYTYLNFIIISRHLFLPNDFSIILNGTQIDLDSVWNTVKLYD